MGKSPQSYRLLTGALGIFLLLCPARGQSPDLAEKAHHAKELMAAGKFGEALQIYRELAKAVPANPGLIMNIGLALDLSGKKREAVREYQAALKLDPNFYPALLLEGTAYLDLGEPARALDPLEKFLKAQPGNPEAEESLSETLLALGRFGEAARGFEGISRADPGNAKALYGLGLSYDGLAQQSFDDLEKAGLGSAYWLDLVGESRLGTKQDYAAFYFYRQALAKMPSMPGVHSAIAEVYRDTGHPDWAAVEEEKERQLPPLDCAVQKLACAFRSGDFHTIVEATEQAKTLEEYYWRTRACNKLALGAYVRLGQLPPTVETHELRAEIEFKRRQYAESAKEWAEALKLAPGDPGIERQLAISLYQSGDLEGARALFEGLLKRQPDSADLNYFLGDTVLHAQKPQEAIVYLEKAVEADPQLLPAQRSLGLAYLQIGQAEKAIPRLKEALPIDDDGSVHYQLGRAYQAHGERDLAAAMFKQYQEMHSTQEAENKNIEKKVAITPPE